MCLIIEKGLIVNTQQVKIEMLFQDNLCIQWEVTSNNNEVESNDQFQHNLCKNEIHLSFLFTDSELSREDLKNHQLNLAIQSLKKNTQGMLPYWYR